MEALRRDRALSLELEEVLENNAAIVSARAIVRLNAVGGRAKTPAGVAVEVREREQGLVTSDRVREIVKSVFPNVRDEHVVVGVSALPDSGGPSHLLGVQERDGSVERVPLVPFLLFWDVPANQRQHLTLVVLCFVGIVGILGGSIGYGLAYYRQARYFFRAEFDPELNPSLAFDRTTKKLPEG